MEKRKKLLNQIFWLTAIFLLAAVEFCMHRKTGFMMDDIWYGTNLATGEPLRSLRDIVEGQIWHFMNWGGRSMTHAALQLTLMSGELAADIINLAMTLLLSYLICVLAGVKKPMWFLAAFSMLITWNPNWRMSMFWQAGAANYIYSTVWILLFLLPYIRQAEGEEVKLPLVTLWIVPLGILSGWSNENMGPASFLFAAAVMVYLKKWKKRRLPLWMLLGAVCSGIGSVLVVAAPGNFVRSMEVEEGTSLAERSYSMLRAGASFLFPSGVVLLMLILIYTLILKEKLKPVQWLLLAMAILSYGAMFLSPHYPDRAAFGTMVLFLLLILSILGAMVRKKEWLQTYAAGITLCSFAYAVYCLAAYMYLS